MTAEIKIHEAQAQILKTLLFKTEARFGQLNVTKLTTDHFTFHLKQLVKIGLVKKGENGKYCLTAKGKEFANRFDTEKLAVEKQAKLTILIVAIKKQKGKIKFLTQIRLKQPFYGYRAFVTGKIRWGEKVLETAARELKEETGLSGKLKFAGIEHKMDYDKDTKLMLEDKFFYIIKAIQTKGKLIKNFEGGKNSWLREKEILADKKAFEDIPKIIEGLKTNQFFFIEDKYQYSSKQY